MLPGLFATHARGADFPFQNPSLPIDQRVTDLVGRMTAEEKISQMSMTAAAIPRLGIPEYTWWNEGLHGIARSGYATVFPQAIGLAATWDTSLLHSVGDTIATEARAKYSDAIAHGNHSIYFGLTIWSPNINIFRDPRWGRGQETYGEDPYLTSRMGLAFVTGLQGNDPKYLKTIATPKHFAVHSGPEQSRHGFDVNPSPQDLEATYLPAFHTTIQEGHAASTMCAYNAIDGAPACANDMLLKKTLRGEWSFGGFVTSDCGAVTDIWKGHKFAPDEEHAAALALRAGTDTSCGSEFDALNQALKDKLVSESEIDTAVKRLFTARFRLGMFDPPQDVPYAHIPMSEVDSQAHRELARKVARESIVLLKNANGILPLDANTKTIAVIGPNATVLESLEGNYNGQPTHPVLPLDGIEKRFHQSAVCAGFVLCCGLSVGGAAYCVANRQCCRLKGRILQQRRVEGSTGTYPGRQASGLRLGRRLAGRRHILPAPSVSAGAVASLCRGRVTMSSKYHPKIVSPAMGWRHSALLLDDKQVLEAGRDHDTAHGAGFLHACISTIPHPMRSVWNMRTPLPCLGRGCTSSGSPKLACCVNKRCGSLNRPTWSLPS